MSTQTLRVAGQRVADPDLAVPGELADAVRTFAVDEFRLAATRDGGVVEQLEARDDDVLELTLEDNTRLWMSVADFRRDFGEETRDGGGIVNIEPTLRFGRATRGPGRWLVKGLRLIGIDLVAGTAARVAGKIDSRVAPGLFSCALEADAPDLTSPRFDGSDAPLLVLIHGTASSTAGSFGDLWSAARTETRRRLARAYSGRCYALQHRTLGESPLDNAIALARVLPDGARLHLVTHSRGGLVGELLCRAGRESDDGTPAVPFDELDYSALGTAGETGEQEKLRTLAGLLERKRLRIERFVRVACPARGTTLASEQLDRLLSVLHRGLGRLGKGWLDDLTWFALAVVKERTDPRTLPGLQAMMPDSGLVKLLNRSDLSVAADLRVIAGDFAGEGIVRRLADWASEWFFAGSNDAVVNTPSMYGGAPRAAGRAWYYRVSGARVWHFSYFEEPPSVARLVDGLLETDGRAAGYRPLADAPDRDAVIHRGPRPEDPFPDQPEPLAERNPSAGGRKPLLVLVPGIMGSQLNVGRFRIWVDALLLPLGRFSRLDLDRGGADVTAPAVLDPGYRSLADHLRASHEVLPFPYDWRRSLQVEGSRLADWMAAQVLPAARANGRPVRILAHSMGGLLVKAAMARSAAESDPDRQWWARLRELPGSRLVMAGTPNRGSWLVPIAFSGREDLVRTLGAVDLKNSVPDLLRVISTFDGFLEMSPEDPDRDWFDPATWQALKAADAGGLDWPLPDPVRLARCKAVRALLDGVTLNEGPVLYVAGQAPNTPTAPILDSALTFGGTSRGDGRVPWDLGIPAGVKAFYMEAVHGDLLNVRMAFPALVEILNTGDTTLLPTEPKASVSMAASRPRGLPYLPDTAMLARAALGADLLPADAAAEDTAAHLRVSVCHGDLSAARHPVVVGHYQGDAIFSAESVLDSRLGGLLARSLRLLVYPGPIGSASVFHGPGETNVGIVIGLGEVGSLRAGGLARAFASGLLQYVSRQPPKPERQQAVAISTLLIGTSAGGMPLRDSVRAIIDGVRHANSLLTDEDGAGYRVVALEFIELFEDRALQALRAVRQMVMSDVFPNVEFDCDLRQGPGYRRRPTYDEPGGWWQRVRIEFNSEGMLQFTALTDQARAPVIVQPTQRALVERFVRDAIKRPDVDAREMRALYELLVPNPLKARAPDQDNVQLILDEAAAAYPWEMMYTGEGASLKPLALNAGLLRQLSTQQFRAQPIRSRAARALVVGVSAPDRTGDYPALPGVPDEILETERALAATAGGQEFAVVRSLDEDPRTIVTHLFDGEYRVLHLAGHGIYRHAIEYRVCGEIRTRYVSGVVLRSEQHKDPVLLSPAEVQQMTRVPELVFINCCHLGSIGQREAQDFANHNALAANLATEFIRMGVRAVVAAGWAVDDRAAQAFAGAFYRTMNSGQTFGDAVRNARKAAHDASPGSNTWAAYQCYGDPAYRFHEGDDEAPRPYSFMSPVEALCAIRAIESAHKAQAWHERGRRRLEELERLSAALRHEWLQRGDIRAALGATFAELGELDEAIGHYQAAARCHDGRCTLRDLDQLSNLIARRAEKRCQADRSAFAQARTDLEQVIADLRRRCEEFGETTDRCTLLASACKRLLMCHVHARTRPSRARTELLGEMAHWYETVAGLEGEIEPYAALNRVAATLLTALSGEGEPLDPGRIREVLRECREKGVALYAADPRFWNGVHAIDAGLLEAVLDTLYPGGQKKALRERLTALAEQYRDLADRHGSPRMLDSVITQIQFLGALIPRAQEHTGLRQELKWLADMLARNH